MSKQIQRKLFVAIELFNNAVDDLGASVQRNLLVLTELVVNGIF